MRWIFIGLPLALAVLAVVFRREFAFRILAIVVIAIMALVYVNILNGAHGMAIREHVKNTQRMPSAEWQDGAQKTQNIVEKSNQLGFSLFAALCLLAVLPYVRRKKSQPPVGGDGIPAPKP